MDTLFDAGAKADRRRRGHSEPFALFLNRVEDEAFARVRSLVEEWHGRLPSEAGVREDHAGRLRSPDDREFLGAFWELYLHETFRETGCRLTPHPATRSSKRPDWLVTSPQGPAFYLEAKVVVPDDWDHDPRAAELLDEIDRVPVTDFLLGVEIVGRTNVAPSGSRARHAVASWIEGLDRDGARAAYARDGFDGLPVMTWEEAGWELAFRAFPLGRRSAARGNGRTLALFGPRPGPSVDPVAHIQRALRKKASRYGELELPFVIAVARFGTTFDDIAVVDALFGGHRTEGGSRTDGFWLQDGRPRRTRVSAVAVVRDLLPWNVATAQPRLFHNPSPRHPFEGPCPWPETRFDAKGSLVPAGDGVAPKDLFAVEPDWPGRPRLV